MRTVFLGTSDFAAAVLERLASSEHSPALVVTRPDRPAGRGRKISSPPVALRARELGLELAQPENVNGPEGIELINGAREGDGGAGAPGPVVVCAFGALITEPLLSVTEMLNVHPSLLPRWRGAAPIERAIMAADEQTGVSIMRLTAGLDSGPVCLKATEPIRPDDTFGSLSQRLQSLGGELLLDAIERSPGFVEQSEDGVTYAEKIAASDRLLDPARPALELELLIRALHPHIGARAGLPDGSLIGVHRAALLDGDSTPSCEGVFEDGGRLLFGCRPGLLELLVVQPPGGRPMDGSAYLRGHVPGRA
ncbi:MAG TPA: methionyl-tRNA formyltransferase [Solirubrobacteraceae bacterium]|jgi:methionyl-tRNA formyltransferase